MSSPPHYPLTWEQAVAWARSQPEKRELVLNCYYDDPIEDAAERFWMSEEWEATKNLLNVRPGSKVLEIGAGRGIVSWAFARLGCDTYALEPNPSELVGVGAIRQLSERTAVKINIVEQAGERLPFDDGFFDCVCCRSVLHHVLDLKQTTREVFRVLRRGGSFLAVKEHVAETADELGIFLRNHPLHFLYGGENAYPLREYKDALSGAGFRRISTFGQFDHAVSWSPQYRFDDIRATAVNALGRRVSRPVADLVFRSDAAVRLFGWMLTRKGKVPGRLYSFLASKG